MHLGFFFINLQIIIDFSKVIVTEDHKAYTNCAQYTTTNHVEGGGEKVISGNFQ